MNSTAEDSTFFGEGDQDEYDAFFSAEDRPKARSSREAVQRRSDASADIESEYAMLSPRQQGNGSPPAHRQHNEDQGISSPPASASVATFALDDDEDDAEDIGDEHREDDYFQFDCRPPELPAPPADFSEEDLALRVALSEFYLRHNADNLASINVIVEKYRGRAIADLWVQLGVKYQLVAADVVELLARTLYLTTNFEHPEEDVAADLTAELRKLRASLPVGVLETGPGEEELLHQAMALGTSSGSDGLFRMLCFRGFPEGSEIRPKAWKVLLGYLQVAQYAEWDAVLAGKRALYASYRSRFLVVTSSHKLEVKVESGRLAEALDVLQQIQKDVDRTRQDVEAFQRPSTRCALTALLFVYAQLNPNVRYVQGMHEIAAVILQVMLADSESAEADTFWCFSQIMEEIKAGFIQALDNSSEGSQATVNSVERLLRIYEPALWSHLNKNGNPQAMFIFRWCTTLFAQDATLADIVRLWDYFLAEPKRCTEAVIHFSLAVLLNSREELLQAGEHGALVQVLRAAPRHRDLLVHLRCSWAICSLERRTRAPAFPVRTAKQLVGDLSAFAQSTAARARIAGAEVTRSVRQNIAPAVKEKAGHASGLAAVAAQDGAQKVQTWLDESAPARKEALEKAQVKLSSLWQTVRATTASAGAVAAGAAATAAATPAGAKAQNFISECSQSETVENAKARLSSVAGTAASTSSKVITKFFETI